MPQKNKLFFLVCVPDICPRQPSPEIQLGKGKGFLLKRTVHEITTISGDTFYFKKFYLRIIKIINWKIGKVYFLIAKIFFQRLLKMQKKAEKPNIYNQYLLILYWPTG